MVLRKVTYMDDYEKVVANALATAATFWTAATGLNILNGIDNYSGKVRVATNGKIYLPKCQFFKHILWFYTCWLTLL